MFLTGCRCRYTHDGSSGDAAGEPCVHGGYIGFMGENALERAVFPVHRFMCDG